MGLTFPREEKFGCLFGFVGAVIGFLIGCLLDAAAAERMLRQDPDIVVDFLPVGTCGGMFAGCLLAVVIGMLVSRLVPPRKRDANEVAKDIEPTMDSDEPKEGSTPVTDRGIDG